MQGIESGQQLEQGWIGDEGMQTQSPGEGEKVAQQGQDQIQSLGGEGTGDQGKHPVGSHAHDDLHHAHDHCIQIVKQAQHVLAALAGQGDGDTEQQGEHDDLQHVALGQGGNRIGRYHTDEDLGQRWRGLALERYLGTAGIESLSRSHRRGQQQGDADRHRRGEQVEQDRFDTHATQGRQVTQRGNPVDQGDEHQRYHQHLQCSDEDRADHIQQTVDQVLPQQAVTANQQIEQDPQQGPQAHGKHDPAGQGVRLGV